MSPENVPCPVYLNRETKTTETDRDVDEAVPEYDETMIFHHLSHIPLGGTED